MGGIVGRILDPAGIFRHHGGGGHAPVPQENVGEQVGSTAPIPVDHSAQAAQLMQSPMGQRLGSSNYAAAPPPPPAHWGYTPGQGTSWMTPGQRVSSDNQYNWNATAPGAAPGNRI